MIANGERQSGVSATAAVGDEDAGNEIPLEDRKPLECMKYNNVTAVYLICTASGGIVHHKNIL